MRLDSVFPKRLVTADPETHLTDVVGLMEEHGVGTVVITREDRPIGIVTDRDIALALGTGRCIRAEPVRIIMSTPVSTINCHEGIFAACEKLRANSVRRLPIVDENGRAVGLVSADDLLMLLGREAAHVSSAIGQELALAE